MKKFGLVLMMLVMASLLVVSAAAEITVSYDIVKDEVCVNADVYRVDVSMLDNNGANFKSFATYITYDSNVLVPYDGLYDEAITDTANWYYCVSPVISNITGRPAAEQISSTPGYPKVEATKIDIELYDSDVTSATVLPDNQVIVSVYFVLAEGKTLADVTEDVFQVNRVIFTNDVNMYDTNAASGDIITIDNNVPQPVTTKLTIAVKAGDVVYFQDGTSAVVDADNDAYEIPATEGIVVVNTGYTAQKVYTVAGGAVTEDTAKADGVISTGEASIRDDSTASGIRFKTNFLTGIKSVVSEYGYITTVESEKTGLAGTEYVLNMDLVDANKAVKAEAYIAGTDTDIFWNVEDDKTVVTAVVTNVPMSKVGVTTNIVTRPYYKLTDGTVVYGEAMTRTVYEVALNIKENDADTYAKYQSYIDEILALCDEADVVIDFGPLFK